MYKNFLVEKKAQGELEEVCGWRRGILNPRLGSKRCFDYSKYSVPIYGKQITEMRHLE